LNSLTQEEKPPLVLIVTTNTPKHFFFFFFATATKKGAKTGSRVQRASLVVNPNANKLFIDDGRRTGDGTTIDQSRAIMKS